MFSKRRHSENGKNEKRKKKSCEETPQLCSVVNDEQFKAAVKEAWSQRTSYIQGDLELDCHPFPHCIIRNFLSSSTFIESLQSELMGLNFHEKSNDLYKFKQSDDLKRRTEPHIAGLSEYFSLDLKADFDSAMIERLWNSVPLGGARRISLHIVAGVEKHMFLLLLCGSSPIEEMQHFRINTMNRCTILASCCGHLLFMSQQNVMVGLSSQMLCTEASTRAELFGRFRCWLGEVLGVPLESTVDISCARYEYTDVLLCHDDELEGRRVAFILYLVPPWQSSDGGTLDLYSTDSNFQPQSIVKTLVPSLNTLVLFEVSPVSFHQVAEVLTKDKCRLSLSGWFHGPSLERPPHYAEAPIPRSPHLPRDESVLLEWVNPIYLDISHQEQIQQKFEDSSEIQLKGFLKKEKFGEVSNALQLTQIQWTRTGPPNKRCYDVASLGNLPQCVRECWELLHSEAFFLLLSNFTGLRLHYLCPDDEDDDKEQNAEARGTEEQDNTQAVECRGSFNESPSSETSRGKELSTPVCCGELRRWFHGGYTLLHDVQAARAEFALDLLLTFCAADWQSDFGGTTCYVANEEDEELLTVYPEDNSLALVYRDKETLKFVKHINHKSYTDSTDIRAFYDFSFVYFE